MFKLRIGSTVLRFYLMMAIAIIAVYAQQTWLIALAIAVGVSAVLGYSFGGSTEEKNKVVHMKGSAEKRRRQAS